MRIGVPRQTAQGERRVPVTPDVAGRLIAAGHSVVVESGAGLGAGHPDEQFTSEGADVGSDDQAWAAEMVITIEPPSAQRSLGSGGALLGLLRPFDEPEEMLRLAVAGITSFAFEAMPRTTKAQAVDVLSSQATVAGYQAVLEAAASCDRFFPMLTTAAGTIRPAKVVVLGAGVAGLQAIATARRLGAQVAAFDVRAAAAEQVRSLGASFITLDLETQDASTSGGYAKEVSGDEQATIIAGLAPHLSSADAVITTAAIPGRRAPLLISTETVATMRPGAVIVDVAASTGGNCELTEPGSTIVHHGVVIIGDTDLVSRTPAHASHMYARNAATFLGYVTGEEGAFEPDWEEPIVSESCITRDGEIVHPRVREAMEN